MLDSDTSIWLRALASAICPNVEMVDNEGKSHSIDLNQRQLFFKRNLNIKMTLSLMKSTASKIDSFLNNPAVIKVIAQTRMRQNNNFNSELDRVLNRFSNYNGARDRLAPHISNCLTRMSSNEDILLQDRISSSRVSSDPSCSIVSTQQSDPVPNCDTTINDLSNSTEITQNIPVPNREITINSSSFQFNPDDPDNVDSVSLVDCNIATTQMDTTTIRPSADLSSSSGSSDFPSATPKKLYGQANRENKNSAPSSVDIDESERLDILESILDKPCPLDQADPVSSTFNFEDQHHFCWGPDKDKGCPAHFDIIRRRAFFHRISSVDLVTLGFLHTATPRCTCVSYLHSSAKSNNLSKRPKNTLNRLTSSSLIQEDSELSQTDIRTSSSQALITSSLISTQRERSQSSLADTELMNKSNASSRSNSINPSRSCNNSVTFSGIDDILVYNRQD